MCTAGEREARSRQPAVSPCGGRDDRRCGSANQRALRYVIEPPGPADAEQDAENQTGGSPQQEKRATEQPQRSHEPAAKNQENDREQEPPHRTHVPNGPSTRPGRTHVHTVSVRPEPSPADGRQSAPRSGSLGPGPNRPSTCPAAGHGTTAEPGPAATTGLIQAPVCHTVPVKAPTRATISAMRPPRTNRLGSAQCASFQVSDPRL